MADTSTFELVITSSDFSLLLGHHQFTCHIEETQPDGTVVEGTPQVYGIEVSALQSRFGNDLEQWLAWVQAQMLGQYQARVAVHQEILQWRGRRMAIAPIIAPSTEQPVQANVSRRQRRRRLNRARLK